MGTACEYHTAPAADAMRRIPPNNGGINEMRLGVVCGYHAAPIISAAKKKNPPSLGGIILFERGGVWISRRLVLAVAGKNPPQMIGRDKKNSNGAVCGMHTARLRLEGQMRWCVGCTLPHWYLEGRTRWCVGCTPPRSHLQGQTSWCVGCILSRWLLK